MSADTSRFNRTIARFDAANAEDPHRENFEGADYPKELLYAQRMTAWLGRLAPDAPETLRLAVRCQHIRRWTLPRSEYPMNREGYKLWRTTLYDFHAETAGNILREEGYDEQTIQRVQSIVRKERIKRDAEAQLLEDVVCLVFLESYFVDFSAKHDENKLIDIVRKTWMKMSDQGHAAALTLKLPPNISGIVQKALA